jgi:anti-anti-sigma factor
VSSSEGRAGPPPRPTPFTRLLPGDHACWCFRSVREHRAGMTAFIRHGLERGSKVLCLADAVPVATVAGNLRRAGVDPRERVARGQLVLLSLAEGYGRGGAFDPERQLELYHQLLERARAEGYRGLWITGEGTWELRGKLPGSERALEYERLVERFLATTEDALALCQYDAAAALPHAAEQLRSVHNLELSAAGVRPLDREVLGLRIEPAAGGLAVSGEADVATWPALSNALRRLADTVAEGPDARLDLTGLSFIDGHAVGLIALAARRLGRSRRLLVRGAPPTLLRIAEILNLDHEPGLVLQRQGGDGGG